jgi:hypothetical protein
MCTDHKPYELVVEKQKHSAHCEQARESWKWLVAYHGTIVASGSVNNMEDAQQSAVRNIPQ